MTNKYDKLIELLNQYEIERGMGSVFNIWKFAGELHYYDNYTDEFVFDNVKLYIISKEYGFIKRLIDNDKIDKSLWNVSIELYHTSYTMYEAILMLLAISDTPIEDLISYLK